MPGRAGILTSWFRRVVFLIAFVSAGFLIQAAPIDLTTAGDFDGTSVRPTVTTAISGVSLAPRVVDASDTALGVQTAVLPLPKATRSSPTAAGVAAEESGAVLNFGSKAAARQGLDGDLGTAANRFFRDATSKSQDFQAQQLSGGGYRLQFFSPANNPGYGKLYVQEIDSAGNVVREFKNTMGPDGLIETKWVHGGP